MTGITRFTTTVHVALIAKFLLLSLALFTGNMAHIKHFIAFILATAAFPLVVTLPISGTLKLSRRDTHPDPQAAAPSFKLSVFMRIF